MTSSNDIIFLINSRFDAIERRFDAQDARIDAQISQVRSEIKELRTEMQEQNAQLRGEIAQVRNEVGQVHSEVRVNTANIANLKDTITWGIGILSIVIMLVGFSGFVAAGFRELFSLKKEEKEHNPHLTLEQVQSMIDASIKKHSAL